MTFLDAGGEVAVPEESHLFQKWRRSIHHAFQPPAAQIEDLFAFHHADLAFLFLLLRRIFRGARGHAQLLDIARMRPDRRCNIDCLGTELDQSPHGRAQALSPERRDFLRATAEPGPIQEMGGALLVPLRRGERSEHVKLNQVVRLKLLTGVLQNRNLILKKGIRKRSA